jgi:CRISPR/Cas system CMR-associated protein Cmr3 (group 5 of RAMP superfamily)
MSRLDYDKSLLFGLPNTQLDRLQCIQNCAARIITRTKRQEHITPILKDLHWLQVQQRIKYKILLLTYKVLNNFGPPYLTELFEEKSSTWDSQNIPTTA